MDQAITDTGGEKLHVHVFHKSSLANCWNSFKGKYHIVVPHKLIKPGLRNKPAWSQYRSVKRAKKAKESKVGQLKKKVFEADKLLHDLEVQNLKH